MRKINAIHLFVIWLVFAFVLTGIITVSGTIYAYNHGLAEIDLPNGAKMVVALITIFFFSPFLLFISQNAKKEHRKGLMYISLGLFVFCCIAAFSNVVPLIREVWGA